MSGKRPPRKAGKHAATTTSGEAPAKKPPQKRPDESGGEPAFEPIEVTSHRALLARQPEIARRLNSNPELAKLLFVNPAMVFKEVGVVSSTKIQHHILETVQYPPKLRQRREELIAKLEKELGTTPHPNDPAWASEILFNRLKIEPLDTQGLTPAYKPPIEPQVMDRLNALRPKGRRADRYAPRTRSGAGSFAITPSKQTARRIDLDAKLPLLRPLDRPPERVELEQLYFYKESHPLARDLLELAIIERQAVPIQSADSFRKIKSGTKRNAFHTWVDSVTFPEGAPHEPDR